MRWVDEPFGARGRLLAVWAALATTPSSAVAADGGSPSAGAAALGATPALTSAEAVASYDWDARLDAQDHRVTARGTIRLRNVANVPLEELWFHFYLNAFESDDTLFLRKGGGRSGSRAGRAGSLRVRRLFSSDDPSRELTPRLAAHSPGDPHDRTDLSLPLDSPLMPGAILELKVEFEATLPEIVERTGFAGNFHLVAQWFPKLAKLEPDGHFAHFAFHPFAEFYADFGDYHVRLDVPEEHVVGSTGELRQLGREAGRAVYEAHARSVHDFAWVSAPGLIVEERRLGTVNVRLLSGAGGARTRATLWSTLESALPRYQQLYGAYPYPSLTVVHPPSDAGPAGGMEYPTFFTVGQPPLARALGARWLETVTAHELGHQWFQGLLASHEARYPFLDEGLTSHAEWRFLQDTFGDDSQLRGPLLQVSRDAIGRYSGLASRQRLVVTRPASEFPSFSALAHHVYGRTALLLETLRRVYGDEAYDRAMLGYALERRFSHPTPSDLYAALGRIDPRARRAAEEWLERRGRLSLRLGALRTEARGDHLLSRIEVLRSGSVRLPFELQIRLSDGSVLERRLEEPAAREQIEFSHALPIVEIRLDPRRKLLLDESLFDNRAYPRGRTLASRELPRLRWLAELALRLLSP